MLWLMLALAAPPQDTDTTVALQGATRLELSSFEGDIRVSTWDRPAVRIQADHDDDTRISVETGGRTLRIHARTRGGPPEVRWRLTVPASLVLDLSAHSGDVEVSGVRSEVRVSAGEGDVTVRGGRGFVAVQSVEGAVLLEDVDGDVSVSSVDGAITVRQARGELSLSAVDGAITMEGISASRVEASTVDGEVRFDGALQSGGRYRLASHDGDVTVTAAAIDAEVSVSTFSGEFESDFPVTLRGTGNRRRLTFTLGRGDARLELESFDGTVALRRGTRR